MFCTQCGAKLPDNAKFCNQCGAMVEVIEPNVIDKAVEPEKQPEAVVEQPAAPEKQPEAVVEQTVAGTEQPKTVVEPPVDEVKPAVNANQSAINNQKKNTGIIIGIVVAVAVVFIVIFIIAAFVTYQLIGHKSNRVEDVAPPENVTEVSDAVEATDDVDSEDAASESEQSEQDTTVPDGSAYEILNNYYQSLPKADIDGASYDHVKHPSGGYYECEGLPASEQYDGFFYDYYWDFDEDGEVELLAFSLESESDNDIPYHNIFMSLYDVDGTGKAEEKSKELVDSAFAGYYDAGDMRVMIKDGKYICVEASNACYLEADGSSVAMKIYYYDGKGLIIYADTAFSGSDWYEAGKYESIFINSLKNIGLERSAYLMQHNDSFYFSAADMGMEPIVKLHAEAVGEYSDNIIQTQIKIVRPQLDNEYLLYGSNSYSLSEAEVNGLTKEKLRIARNEIYARYGWRFEDPALREYFNNKAWYSANYGGNSISDDDLTAVEKANRDIIVEVENSK